MISSFRKASKWTTLALVITLMVGCSTPSNPQKTPDKPPRLETGTVTPAPTDAQKDLLTNIMQLANQGKVINCEFAAKTTVIDTVIKQWGNPDKTDWVPTAKGHYATFSKHNVVFGYNKGRQIFEVRTFESQLSQISLSKAKQFFGTPPYEVNSKGEQIIGYTAGKEFKLVLVFPQPSANYPNPVLDHYSVLYPQGTVNSMAGDPGRQW